MRLSQQAIELCTDFQKLLAECQIQTEIPVFLHRRNDVLSIWFEASQMIDSVI